MVSRKLRIRTRWALGLIGLVGMCLLALLVLRSCSTQSGLTVVAVGDMACAPDDPQYNDGKGRGDDCGTAAVAARAAAVHPDLILGLGDYQYEVPTADDYMQSFDPAWGSLKDLMRPALGNQELKVNKAKTFYDYFGQSAMAAPGYGSYDMGGWHFVVLNTNCTVVEGGCGSESPQVDWLKRDLAAHAGMCTIAYGHHPRWSNGIAGPDNRLDPLYSTMVNGHVSVYLSGHESDYERFPPLDAAHQPAVTGVRQIVVGTGGQSLYAPKEGDAPWRKAFDPIPSEYFSAQANGILSLHLGEGNYQWSFETDKGKVLDSGSGLCISP